METNVWLLFLVNSRALRQCSNVIRLLNSSICHLFRLDFKADPPPCCGIDGHLQPWLAQGENNFILENTSKNTIGSVWVICPFLIQSLQQDSEKSWKSR